MHSKYYRWELLALLSMAFFFHQADRALFGLLLTPIQEDLQLSDSQMGLTGTVLFATLAFLMPVAGYIGDRFSKKWIVISSLLFWSLSTMMTGLAKQFGSLLFFRSVATAGGESFYAPAAYPLLAAWHKTTRSLALSVHQAALYIGVMSSGFLAGWIAENFGGWRSAFYLYGGLGILLGLVFIFRLKGMPQETVEKETVAKEKPPKVSFGKIFFTLARTPTLWFLTMGFTAVVFVNNAYIIWAPSFLEEKFQLNLTMAGWNAMFYHHIAALGGIMLGGVMTDWLVRHFRSFRLQLQLSSLLLGAPAIYFVGASGSLGMTCLFFALFGLFRGFYETNTHAALFDVVTPEYRSSAVALMTFIAFLIGSTSATILGILANWYGKTEGLSLGFQLMGGVYFLGSLAILAAWLFTFQRDRIPE